jgi:hypothetical protein
MVALESQWLLWQVTGYYGKSLGAKDVYVCFGKSKFDIWDACYNGKSLVAMRVYGCY